MADAVFRVLSAGLVPFIHGSPGIGKSDIVKKIAKDHNLKLIDLRMSQILPEDLNGFPMRNGDTASYVPFDFFPLEDTPIPDGYSGWLIFLDEMNSATKVVQAASYKLILDRLVGNRKLHPQALIAAAGNKATDKAIVNQMGTATQSRLIHLELSVNVQDWLGWAMKEGIDFRITSFIEQFGRHLHDFNPNHQKYTFPCPRTWYFLSNIIKGIENLDDYPEFNAIAAGTVSESASVEFMTYCKIMDKLPRINTILSDPESVDVPTRSDIRYAVMYYVAEHTEPNNFDTLVKYIKKFPAEFQTVYLKSIVRKTSAYLTNPVYTEMALNLFRFTSGRNSEFKPL